MKRIIAVIALCIGLSVLTVLATNWWIIPALGLTPPSTRELELEGQLSVTKEALRNTNDEAVEAINLGIQAMDLAHQWREKALKCHQSQKVKPAIQLYVPKQDEARLYEH